MLDIPALPIAFALTLWDALPLFISVSVALALIARSTLHGQSFHRTWSLRDSAGIEGMLYAAIFQPNLVPLLAVAAVCASIPVFRRTLSENSIPVTPANALKVRAEEMVVHVLLASAVAAVIKVSAPDLPEALFLQVCIASLAGALVGFRAGAAAIPAVAVAVHLGGSVPALACIAAAALISIALPTLRKRRMAERG